MADDLLEAKPEDLTITAHSINHVRITFNDQSLLVSAEQILEMIHNLPAKRFQHRAGLFTSSREFFEMTGYYLTNRAFTPGYKVKSDG